MEHLSRALMKYSRKLSLRRGFFGLGLMLLLSNALAGCDVVAGHRYRITVTVDVNGTPVSGSSVQAFRCHNGINNMDVSQCTIKGEAVVVDLKDRGYLFLIFRMPNRSRYTEVVKSVLGARGQDAFKSSGFGLPNKWTLDPDERPMLVSFGNINDPMSVQEVDGANLSKTYGGGIKLKNISVEETNDSVTWNRVDSTLPWLKSLGDKLFDGHFGTSGNELYNTLQRSDFIFGE